MPPPQWAPRAAAISFLLCFVAFDLWTHHEPPVSAAAGHVWVTPPPYDHLAEDMRVASILAELRPLNILVFGTPRKDMDYYSFLADSRYGKCVYVYDARTIAVPTKPQCGYIPFAYNDGSASVERYASMDTEDLHDRLFVSALPDDMFNVWWDAVIIEEHPYANQMPGRAQAIYTVASRYPRFGTSRAILIVHALVSPLDKLIAAVALSHLDAERVGGLTVYRLRTLAMGPLID